MIKTKRFSSCQLLKYMTDNYTDNEKAMYMLRNKSWSELLYVERNGDNYLIIYR